MSPITDGRSKSPNQSQTEFADPARSRFPSDDRSSPGQSSGFEDEADTAELPAPFPFRVEAGDTHMVFESVRPVTVWICTDAELVVDAGPDSTFQVVVPAGGALELRAASVWVRVGEMAASGLYHISQGRRSRT